jgi:hypothetical protein
MINIQFNVFGKQNELNPYQWKLTNYVTYIRIDKNNKKKVAH